MLRKLMLLATMAVAALALSATSAMAQEAPVEVVDAHTLEHCSPCNIIVEGESRLNSSIWPPTELSSCVDTFEGEIYEDGSGHVPYASILLEDHPFAPFCNATPCADVEWPFALGEVGAGSEHLNIMFCLQGAQPCTVEVDVIDNGNHHYILEAIDELCGPIILNGEWEVHNQPAGHDAIEIIH